MAASLLGILAGDDLSEWDTDDAIYDYYLPSKTLRQHEGSGYYRMLDDESIQELVDTIKNFA